MRRNHRAISAAALASLVTSMARADAAAWRAAESRVVSGTVTLPSSSPHLALQVSEEEDPNLSCYYVVTRETVNGVKQKYTVDRTEDQYVNFTFRAPWQGKQWIRSIKPLIDNGVILTRGRLYRQQKEVELTPPTRSSASHPDAELLHAWASASDVLELEEPVGIPVAEGSVLTLEHHFFNWAGHPLLDGSGFQICVSTEQPDIEVGTSVLGVTTFEGSKATSTCSPALTEPVQVLPVTAYTRYQGVAVTLDKIGVDGKEERLYRRDYTETDPPEPPLAPWTLEPGDKLRVTCTYDKPVKSGIEEVAEACELLVLHSPPGTLVRATAASAVHGAYTCID